MPIYTYRCNQCNYQFEQRQRMTDDPLTECPACEGQVRRVVNSVGVLFKGSGFYITDNRNGNGHTNGKSSSSTTSDAKESTSSGKEKSPTKEATSKEATSTSTPTPASPST